MGEWAWAGAAMRVTARARQLAAAAARCVRMEILRRVKRLPVDRPGRDGPVPKRGAGGGLQRAGTAGEYGREGRPVHPRPPLKRQPPDRRVAASASGHVRSCQALECTHFVEVRARWVRSCTPGGRATAGSGTGAVRTGLRSLAGPG
ncbi:hypothetical protein ACFFX0_16880 [Citricoccus parietis]|uniref:Uncharacterized protein n=1 Tax=Citricoccus parietis TaxID=592307 RepID=A0ABV5G1J7_9MICC